MSDNKTIMEVSVEDFGRVRRADLKVKPLTVLVGENNTGKSWLASLLWGIDRYRDVWRMGAGASLDAAMTLLRERFASRPSQLDAGDQSVVLEAMSHALGTSGKNIVARLLGPDTSVGRVTVSLRRALKQPVYVPERDDDLAMGISWGSEPFQLNGWTDEFTEEDLRVGLTTLAALFNTGSPARSPLYLPASRSGFVLLMERLVSEGLEALGPEPARPVLTAPMAAFTQWLVTTQFDDEPIFKRAAVQLLEEVAAGNYLIERRRINRLSFVLGDGTRLPMQLTSSLVSELAPLALACGDVLPKQLLVVEEPESHLHPQAQRQVVRALTRLVRAGVRVVITTHSENIAQLLNNLIKLGSLPIDKRRAAQRDLGYDADDFLLADEVAGYELRVGEDGRSEAFELPVDEAGMAQPLFNAELRRLSDELTYLRDLLDEDHGT